MVSALGSSIKTPLIFILIIPACSNVVGEPRRLHAENLHPQFVAAPENPRISDPMINYLVARVNVTSGFSYWVGAVEHKCLSGSVFMSKVAQKWSLDVL